MATGSEQKQCVEIRYRRRADEVKGAYGQVLDRASKADIEHPASGDQKSWKTAVTESQRAWEAYRDAECRGVVGRGDGSGTMVWVLGGLAEKARTRAKELKAPYDR
jgi:uncharacterized protein YecT (DUF1311 family)